jgi:hypothetical protein
MPDKKWDLPADSGSNKSGYMEHRGNTPERGEMNDQQLADALDIGVQDAHARIEDVTEHRTTDLSDED